MVHHSPRTAKSTSLDSSSEVRYDDVPERELLVRPTAGLGHGGIAALAVGGEGALLVEGGAGAEAACVRGATRARNDEGEGCRAAAVEVAAAALLGRLADAARGCIRAVATVARERPEQQPLLPPHRRNYQQGQRGIGDGRWLYYCCCSPAVAAAAAAARWWQAASCHCCCWRRRRSWKGICAAYVMRTNKRRLIIVTK